MAAIRPNLDRFTPAASPTTHEFAASGSDMHPLLQPLAEAQDAVAGWKRLPQPLRRLSPRACAPGSPTGKPLAGWRIPILGYIRAISLCATPV